MNMGIAIRMATDMELHVESSYQIQDPTPERIIRAESARRTLVRGNPPTCSRPSLTDYSGCFIAKTSFILAPGPSRLYLPRISQHSFLVMKLTSPPAASLNFEPPCQQHPPAPSTQS